MGKERILGNIDLKGLLNLAFKNNICCEIIVSDTKVVCMEKPLGEGCIGVFFSLVFVTLLVL